MYANLNSPQTCKVLIFQDDWPLETLVTSKSSRLKGGLLMHSKNDSIHTFEKKVCTRLVVHFKTSCKMKMRTLPDNLQIFLKEIENCCPPTSKSSLHSSSKNALKKHLRKWERWPNMEKSDGLLLLLLMFLCNNINDINLFLSKNLLFLKWSKLDLDSTRTCLEFN